MAPSQLRQSLRLASVALAIMGASSGPTRNETIVEQLPSTASRMVTAAVEVRHRKPGIAQDKRKDGRYAGRVRLAVVADRSANSLCVLEPEDLAQWYCQRASESPQFGALKIPHFGGRGDQLRIPTIADSNPIERGQ